MTTPAVIQSGAPTHETKTMRSPSSSDGPWPAHSLLICIRRALFWASFELSSSLAAGLQRKENNSYCRSSTGLRVISASENSLKSPNTADDSAGPLIGGGLGGPVHPEGGDPGDAVVSTTYLMPGMVREVSATLVATTQRRVPAGGGLNTCAAVVESEACLTRVFAVISQVQVGALVVLVSVPCQAVLVTLVHWQGGVVVQSSRGVRLLKWMLTGNWRASTLITGGGDGNSFLLSVKSSTRRVADMMISFMGRPFWREPKAKHTASMMLQSSDQGKDNAGVLPHSLHDHLLLRQHWEA
ncbi:hypothetical protein CRUP_029266 [Coryphaenoides rupestris]|nr:hypothetical protein CRUP_029266 [Coryphaenoides rupestris]